jgi:hypothetical protein
MTLALVMILVALFIVVGVAILAGQRRLHALDTG